MSLEDVSEFELELRLYGAHFRSAVIYSDIFGFHPTAEKFLVPERIFLDDRIPKECAGWWIMAGRVPFSREEAAQFADALEKAMVWLRSTSDEIPSWVDPNRIYWGKLSMCVLRWPRYPGFLDSMVEIAAFAAGGPFRFQSRTTSHFDSSGAKRFESRQFLIRIPDDDLFQEGFKVHLGL
jgi:hypothetical protein